MIARALFLLGSREASSRINFPISEDCRVGGYVAGSLSDIPGDSGSQLPYQDQEFPPNHLAPYLMIGISHFPIQVDSGCEYPLSLFFPTSTLHNAGLVGLNISSAGVSRLY